MTGDAVCLYCWENKDRGDGFCSDGCRESAELEAAETTADAEEAEATYEEWKATHDPR